MNWADAGWFAFGVVSGEFAVAIILTLLGGNHE